MNNLNTNQIYSIYGLLAELRPKEVYIEIIKDTDICSVTINRLDSYLIRPNGSTYKKINLEGEQNETSTS